MSDLCNEIFKNLDTQKKKLKELELKSDKIIKEKQKKFLDSNVKNEGNLLLEKIKKLTPQQKLKLEKQIREHSAVSAANEVIRSNEFFNKVTSKLVSDSKDINGQIQELIVNSVLSQSKREGVENAYYFLGDKFSKNITKKFITDFVRDTPEIKNVVKKLTKNVETVKNAEELEGFRKSQRLEKKKIDAIYEQKRDSKLSDVDKESTVGRDYFKGDEQYVPFSIIPGVRFDKFGKLFNMGQDSKTFKNLIMNILTDGYGYSLKKGKYIIQDQASDDFLETITKKTTSRFETAEKQIFKEGKKLGKTEQEIVMDVKHDSAFRRGNLDYEEQPYLKNYFKIVDDINEELAKSEGKKFGSFDKIVKYTKTSWSHENIQSALLRYGHEKVADTLASSFSSNFLKKYQIEVPEEVLLDIKKSINTLLEGQKTKLTAGGGGDGNLTEIITLIEKNIDNSEVLKEFLRQNKLSKSFQKRSIDFEMQFEKNGFRVVDLLDNNSLAVNKINAIERTKQVNSKRILIVDGSGNEHSINIFSNADIEKLLDIAKKEGIHKDAIKELDRVLVEVRSSRFLEENMNSISSQSLRIVRNLNTATMLGNVLLASTVEYANIIGTQGLGNVIKSHKEIRMLMKKIQNGSLTKKEMSEFEDVLYYLENDALKHQNSGFRGEDDFIFHDNPKGFMEHSENLTAGFGNAVVNKINQLSVFTGMSRAVGFSAHLKKLTNGKLLSEGRYAEIGWTKVEGDSFINLLKKFDSDTSTQKILHEMKKELSFDDYNKFEYGLTKKANRLVLDPNIGEGYKLLNNSSIGKTIFQFQNYITQAFNKMLVSGIRQHDAEFIKGLLSTFFASSMIEMIRRGLKKVGTDEDLYEEDYNLGQMVFDGYKNSSYAANTQVLVGTMMKVLGIDVDISDRRGRVYNIDSVGDYGKTIPSIGKIDNLFDLGSMAKEGNFDAKFLKKVGNTFLPNTLYWQNITSNVLGGR